MKMTEERREEIALERYRVIAPLLDSQLEKSERRRLMKERAEREGLSPNTVERWHKDYLRYGFKALFPKRRRDLGGSRRIPLEVIKRAGELLKENPRRSIARVIPFLEIEFPTFKERIKRSTLSRLLRERGISRRLLSREERAYRSFEATQSNAIWHGDVMHGPWVIDSKGKRRRAMLFAFLDDFSRDIPHAEFYLDERLPRLEDCLKKGILKAGIPEVIFVDNAFIFSSKRLRLICAELGIRKSHSTPYHPQSKGKIERFFRTVRDEFLSEIELLPPMPLRNLNHYFFMWLEVTYRRRRHTQTAETPKERWERGRKELKYPSGEKIDLVFLMREKRVVSKTAQVKLFGNLYNVEPALCGKEVEVRYDPFDLRRIWIWFSGKAVCEGKCNGLIALKREKEESTQVGSSAIGFLKNLESSFKALNEKEFGIRFSMLRKGEGDV